MMDVRKFLGFGKNNKAANYSTLLKRLFEKGDEGY
jgi:hypothetical protein